MSTPSFDDVNIVSEPDIRSEAENRWVSFQPYLLSKGYRLRPRYQPDWVPSWHNTHMDPTDCEDSLDTMPVRVLDAMRIEDESQVIIKMLVPAKQGREGEDELALLQHFSTPPLRNDPMNNVIPCLDVFPIPDVKSGHFVVMPLLGRYEDIPFYNLEEMHDMLRQLFEGLICMHKNRVAHCDIAARNFMMDTRSLYTEPFHPFYRRFSLDAKRRLSPRYTRSEKAVRYYWIDLGYAKWFRDSKSHFMITGKQARQRAPEQANDQPYNPFIADVYQLGAMLQREIIAIPEQSRA